MRGRGVRSLAAGAVGCFVLGLTLGAVGVAGGADEVQRHIWLPPARGATPLSAQIQAQAAYVSAYGEMVESIAVARKINAQAVAQEIENSKAYVEAYFKNRETNRQARAKENPNYQDRQRRAYAAMKAAIEERLGKGNETEKMNWLLRELGVPVLAGNYAPGRGTLAESPLNSKLSPSALKQVRLTDGGRGSRLVFSADEGNTLAAHWPLALRGADSAEARNNFNQARDELLKEIQDKGEAGPEVREKVLQAVNGLFVALEKAYPHERRADANEFFVYRTGKRFVQSLLAAANRAVNASDPHELDGGLRFQGGGVVDLIQHMYRNGLEFAPPEAGGEGVYRALFESLRALYLQLGPDQAGQPREANPFSERVGGG